MFLSKYSCSSISTPRSDVIPLQVEDDGESSSSVKLVPWTQYSQRIFFSRVNEWMNVNLYIAHKKLPHKTLHVHSARYTQCIHVSSRKLKLAKDTNTKKVQTAPVPTYPFPKVELYIAVKCKNIYRFTSNDIRKKNHTHTLTHTHTHTHTHIHTHTHTQGNYGNINFTHTPAQAHIHNRIKFLCWLCYHRTSSK